MVEPIGMEGRVVLVTGGARGIGRAIALRFAQTPAHLFINFFQSRSAAEETAAEAKSRGAQVHLVQADLKDEDQVRGVFGEIRSVCGRLDVLAHNAASGVFRSLLEMTAKQWDWVMNTNARSLLLLAREAAPLMGEGGRIISLSSIGSERVVAQYGAIGISKAALESLTRYLAVELAPRGISVNAISAGAVATEFWDLVPQGEEVLNRVRAQTPLQRILTPEEVAEIVFFLPCTDAAKLHC